MRRFALQTDEKRGAGSIAAGTLQRTFQRAVRTEALLGVATLLVVGVLTSLSPPGAASTSASGPFTHQGMMGNVSYALVINPATVGDNSFEVALTDAQDHPIQQADTVLVRLVFPDMDMGVQEVPLLPVAGKPGYYGPVPAC